MVNRAANATIKGYFYQFDYAILRILNTTDQEATITVEGVEDVDISSVLEESYIQCKYYAATQYNHSVIKPAIAAMLTHFKSHGQNLQPTPEYKLYGHYGGGQEKFPKREELTVAFTKQNFLTTKKDGELEELHLILKITDEEITKFLDLLSVDVYAQSYEAQYETICASLLKIFPRTTKNDVEALLYPASINIVRSLAISGNIDDRRITKKIFIERINNKSLLFNAWLLEYKGIKQYAELVRKTYFSQTSSTSIENKARFFVLPVNSNNFELNIIIKTLHQLSKKFSNIDRVRTLDSDRFCPYVHLIGATSTELVSIKRALTSEGCVFTDGFDYKGADFSLESILRTPNQNHSVKLKFIDDMVDLVTTIQATHRRSIEVFEFYQLTPATELSAPEKTVLARIKVDSMEDILEIIK
jgi:hypothetical protein